MPARSSPPRIEIGTWPSPIVRLDRVSEETACELYVKVEDAAAWSGNKVRKLEYLLADARPSHPVVTAGVGTSVWTAAVAYYAHLLGFEAVVGLAGPVPDPLRAMYARLGTRVITARRDAALPLVALQARRVAGRAARWLPFGGSGGVGDFGSAQAGSEIAAAVADGTAPRPRAIFVASGTGGSAGGVAAGLGAAGLGATVIAVRAAPWPLGTGSLVRVRARRALRALTKVGLARPHHVLGPIEAESRFFAPGYARSNSPTDEAVALGDEAGLVVERTYGGKALAAAVAAARRGMPGPLLMLLTSPSVQVPPDLAHIR